MTALCAAQASAGFPAAVEKTGTDIQDPELSAGGKVLTEFCQPAFSFFTFIFPQTLGLKSFRAQGPVAGDPLFDRLFGFVLEVVFFYP